MSFTQTQKEEACTQSPFLLTQYWLLQQSFSKKVIYFLAPLLSLWIHYNTRSQWQKYQAVNKVIPLEISVRGPISKTCIPAMLMLSFALNNFIYCLCKVPSIKRYPSHKRQYIWITRGHTTCLKVYLLLASKHLVIMAFHHSF